MNSQSDTAGHAHQSGNSFPDYRRRVSLRSIKYGYTILCQHFIALAFVPVSAMLAGNLWHALQTGELQQLYKHASQREFTLPLAAVIAGMCMLCMFVYLLKKSRAVYLVNFSCYKPPAIGKAPTGFFLAGLRATQKFDDKSMEFQERVLARSGLGERTYLPVAFRVYPPQLTLENARKEAEMVMFGAVSDALKKTDLKPSDVGILVVNCSLFNPTPSLAAMIINHFHMRSDIMHFNLSGMGCSAGLIGVDLAVKMLQLHPNRRALVVSTENVTQNWYFGSERSMLMPNCLFRMGCSAVVLSNRWWDSWVAKYELMCPIVRTMTGGERPDAYSCIYQMEDEHGNKGVRLTKQLMSEAGHALRKNITALGPLVLPFSEQLLFAVNVVFRKLLKMQIKSYVPNFELAFDHICIHTGGRAVIEAIEKQMSLSDSLVRPSKDTLFRFGNTSSSSLWYILANIETHRGVNRGDRVWQLGFGSGFKCNSAMWRALRCNREKHVAWLEDQEMEQDPKWLDGHTYEAFCAAVKAAEATAAKQKSIFSYIAALATSGR